jgi:tetratricopeptide (TPR) repeat protein
MQVSDLKRHASSRAVFLTAAFALVLSFFATLAPVPAAAAEFSKEVGQPLQDAQAAIKKGKWDAALASIKKAQAVPNRKPAEDHAINEMLAYVLLNQRNPAGAAAVYEQSIEKGLTPQSKVSERYKTIAQLYAQARQYPKAIDYGNRYLKSNNGDAEMHWLVAQSEYSTNDCKQAVVSTQHAISAARRAGQSPKIDWLRMKLTCLKDDRQAMRETREEMVRYFPSKENWDHLLMTMCGTDAVHERAKLDCYRLMLEVDVLKKPDVYSEMAQIALESGMPAEAARIMERGFANNVFPERDKARHTRLLTQAQEQARVAQNDLAKLQAQANADAKGGGDLQLGGAFMSLGQYDKAVEAIQRGIKKGGIKHVDEAHMMLGRAYIKLKQKEQARRAFNAVADHSPLAEVAQLWTVYAQQS